MRNILLASIVLIITNCAGPLSYQRGLTLSEGVAAAEVPSIDTLRAVLKITVFDGSKKSSMIGAVAALPERRYKMDFLGPMGTYLGSFYWVKDSIWSLVVPKEDLFLQGRHDQVQLPILKLDTVLIHHLLSFLWGKYLMEGGYRKAGSRGNDHIFEHNEWGISYRIDRKTGLVRLAQFNSITLEYREYSRFNERILARDVLAMENNQPLLQIKVKSVEDSPVWKKPPFFIKIPKGMSAEWVSEDN